MLISRKILTVLIGVSPLVAQAEVVVTADVSRDVLRQPLSVGDIVSIPLTIESDRVGVAAVELDLACRSEAIRISSIDFAPMWAVALGEDMADLPGSSYHGSRGQAVETLDRKLGTGANAVPLATVHLEMMQDGPFKSALVVKAQAAILGAREARTVLRIAGSGRPAGKRLSIPVINTSRPSRGDTDTSATTTADVVSISEASVTLLVRDPETSGLVSQLQAGKAYELHYVATASSVNGYLLFAGGSQPGEGVALVQPPSSGAWSNTGSFNFNNTASKRASAPAAELVVDGYRFQQVWDDLWLTGKDSAGATGHLCDFTPAAPGRLLLEFYMWQFDPQGESVEMKTAAQFRVKK